MAFLNGTFLGYSSLQYQPPIPSPISYTKVTFYGGQSIFDKIHIQNIALTNTQIQAITPTDQITWQSTTILLANFDAHTLDGGNIISLPSALVGWKIYRRDTSTNISTLIATVTAGTTFYTDYGVATNKTVYYEIFPYTSSALGSPLKTNNVTTDYYGYYLMNIDATGNIYKFDLELQSSDYQNNENFVQYDTYTQYNSYAIGKRKFFSTSISALAGTITINNELSQDVSYLITLRDFIQNGKVKYFKDRKGNIFAGLTHNYRQKQLNDAISQQVFVVSFDFIETQAV